MIFLRNLEDFLRNLGILWEFLERNLEHFLRYLYLGLLPCAHPTAFSQITLFLDRFSREFWVSNKPYKSDSKNRRLEDSISDVLIVFTFFLSYYGCARIRNHTSIFAGKSAQSNAQNWCRAKQPRLTRL